jgi:hypothetical protein
VRKGEKGGITNGKVRVSRAERRRQLRELKVGCELYQIMRHFFPDLVKLLGQTKDPRKANYVTYGSEVLLFVRILSAAFRIASMRKITESFNTDESIANVWGYIGGEELSELPHWSTINDYLEQLEPEELGAIIPKLINRLIRMRTFEESRIRGKYWQILIDGVHLYSFKERHCPHCLTKEHKGRNGKSGWTEYYHSVLEAKLVLGEDMVFSIITEFIENEEENATKQNCERKAFYRLAEKLKEIFPRLPICLTVDSLYACGPVFDTCKSKDWHYIIRFKDGSIPSVAEEFHTIKLIEADNAITQQRNGETETYRYVCDIPYQAHILNVAELSISGAEYPFVFISDMPITKKNCIRFVDDGRRRWKIENQGFNSQKNDGYGLTHLFSRNENAMKNHYYLIQIGHMIAQLFVRAVEYHCSTNNPVYTIFKYLEQQFRTMLIPHADISSLDQNYRCRFI